MTLSYWQSIVTGFLQGVTELFPISSLGHAVLVPAWIGGSWEAFISSPNSYYLTVTIALHAASALALLIVFRQRWFDMARSTLTSMKTRNFTHHHTQLFLLIIIATIPVAILGKIFEEPVQAAFGKPLPSAFFLTINGVILIMAERLSRKTSMATSDVDIDRAITQHISKPNAVIIGFGQSLALLAGISRFGITMSAGLLRKVNHAAAAEFAFLLALPVIAGASLLKLPELFTAETAHLAGPVIAGSITSFFATYISVKFLVRWFKSKTLYPFAIYCLVVGLISMVKFF